MGHLGRDLRCSWRALWRSPAFAVVATLTLALGIGANSAIFSVVNGVLLRPLPYGDPGRLVMVWNRYAKTGLERAGVSGPDFVERREHSRTFEGVAAYSEASLNLTGRGEPERLSARRVSAEFFQVLGVRPALGRDFLPEEDEPGRAQVAILSHAFWKRRFASDPGLVGKSLLLNGVSHTVVGVLPAGFFFPAPDFDPAGFEVAVPLALTAEQTDPSQRGYEYLQIVGRLKPGVGVEEAREDLARIAQRALEQAPEAVREFFESNGWGTTIVPMQEYVTGEVRPALLLLFGAVGFVLLIACANVSNLLLARAAGRVREIAVRAALGATRGRLLRQLLSESALLALLGGAVGLLLALWGVDLLVAARPANLPRLHEIQLDGQVFLWTGALSVLVGMIFGLAPALHGSRPDLNEALKEGGRPGAAGRARLRSALVVCQISLALVLLVGSGLMVRSLLRLQKLDPGFKPQNILTFYLSLPGGKYGKPQERASFFKQLLERLDALAEVAGCGAASLIPMAPGHSTASFIPEGARPGPGEPTPLAKVQLATPGYFGALGVPLLRGRDFGDRDRLEAPGVAIVDEPLARRFWPGQDPIGRRLTFSEDEAPNSWLTVVGVVGAVQDSVPARDAFPTIYVPHAQMPADSMFVVLRTAVPPRRLIPQVRHEVLGLDPEQPVYAVRTMDEYMDRALAQPRFRAALLSGFAALAMALAAVGVYGVMSYSVAQRTHELGIRLALGAGSGDLLRLVIGQGARLALAGLVLGLAGALALGRVLSGLLYGVTPFDPLTYAAVSLVLGVVALLACYLPARRAMRLSPLAALRYE